MGYNLEFYGKIANHAFINYEWTALESGLVIPIRLSDVDFAKIKGMFITSARTIPGVIPPSDGYDVDFVDDDNTYLFGGTLLNRSSVLTQTAVPQVDTDIYGPIQVYNNFTLYVYDNVVTNSTGVCRLFLNK